MREERLIEEYLTVRAEQAEEAAKEAAQNAALYPENEHMALEAVHAERNARKAKAEFAKQRAHAAQAELELKSYMPKSDTTKATRSWQSIVITEALKAKGAQQNTPLSNKNDAGVETPGSTFRATQAAKAAEAVKGESSDIDLSRRLRRSRKSRRHVKSGKRR